MVLYLNLFWVFTLALGYNATPLIISISGKYTCLNQDSFSQQHYQQQQQNNNKNYISSRIFNSQYFLTTLTATTIEIYFYSKVLFATTISTTATAKKIYNKILSATTLTTWTVTTETTAFLLFFFEQQQQLQQYQQQETKQSYIFSPKTDQLYYGIHLPTAIYRQEWLQTYPTLN